MALNDLSKEQHDELCTTYAALLLHDGEAEITGDSLAAVKAIKPGSVAEESDVAVGMLLGEIGGEDMRGVDYCEFNACCILCPALGGGSDPAAWQST